METAMYVKIIMQLSHLNAVQMRFMGQHYICLDKNI